MIAVYEIVNTTTGKRYIGSTKDSSQRKIRHFKDLNNGKHHCIYLQRAWNKQQGQGFIFNIIQEFDNIESCRAYEQSLLDNSYDKLYNTSKKATGGDLISYHPNRDTIVKNMSIGNIRRYSELGVEGRKILYGKSGKLNGMYGKRHTEVAKKAMSEKHKLNPSKGFLGHTHTEEFKARLSELASTRTGDKNPFYGKKHTKEAKILIGEAHKGVLPSNARKVSAEGITYNSLASCARALHKTSGTIHNRIKSKNFPTYFYVD